MMHTKGHGPVVDPLEPRLLLTAISVSFSRGTLRVTGTDSADNIILRQKRGKLSVLGVKKSVAASLVKKVSISGLGGDDQISIDPSAASLKIKFSIRGGDGNDMITGSARPDTLAGDAGNDTILGGTGNDSILGGGDE